MHDLLIALAFIGIVVAPRLSLPSPAQKTSTKPTSCLGSLTPHLRCTDFALLASN